MKDDDLLALWRDLGIPGVADVHVHFMPDSVLGKVWAYFDGVGPDNYGVEWPITYRFDEQVRIEQLQALGVLQHTALVYAHKPGMAAWLNDWGRDFAARTPGCVRTATFYPEPGAEAYVRKALEDGARAWKVHLQVGDFDPRDELLDPVWGMLAAAGVPVVCHCGSGPMPGRFTGPGPITEMLHRHPGLTLVIAHLGMPEYGEFLDLATRFKNVHLDTTMAFTDFVERTMPFPAGLRPQLRDLAGRVVLGSDFPNIPYPYAHQIEALVRLDLGEEWLRAVLFENGARLLSS